MQILNKQKSKKDKESIFSQPYLTIKGGLIGAAITAFLSWNTVKISKIGMAYRRWKLTRNFILPKRMDKFPQLTNYYKPQVNQIMNNFLCFSGEPGIGKSSHFQSFAVKQSLFRPTFYLKFKSIGNGPTFDSDLFEQVGLGGSVDDGNCVLTLLMNAANRIKSINESPHVFWLKYLSIHLGLVGLEAFLFLSSSIDASLGVIGLAGLISIHLWYTNFTQPFIVQSIRRSLPMIILDDINKMESIGKLNQIARFLKLIDQKSGNILLISSDEDTWIKLRKEPGLKDRLRLHQVYYDHLEVAKNLTLYIQANFQNFMKIASGHRIYSKEVVIGLIQYLIQLRQITLRRFISILRLNDEEEYSKLYKILENKQKLPTSKVVQDVAEVFFETEMETMVANIKAIKRQLANVSSNDFIDSLNTLLVKGKLASDNILGPFLQMYSIVRDQRSQYVFNGRFMRIVYGMAIRQYINDMKQYEEIGKIKGQNANENKAV